MYEFNDISIRIIVVKNQLTKIKTFVGDVDQIIYNKFIDGMLKINRI